MLKVLVHFLLEGIDPPSAAPTALEGSRAARWGSAGPESPGCIEVVTTPCATAAEMVQRSRSWEGDTPLGDLTINVPLQ